MAASMMKNTERGAKDRTAEKTENKSEPGRQTPLSPNSAPGADVNAWSSTSSPWAHGLSASFCLRRCTKQQHILKMTLFPARPIQLRPRWRRARVRARTPSFGRNFGELAGRRRSTRAPRRCALNALVPFSLDLVIKETLHALAGWGVAGASRTASSTTTPCSALCSTLAAPHLALQTWQRRRLGPAICLPLPAQSLKILFFR